MVCPILATDHYATIVPVILAVFPDLRLPGLPILPILTLPNLRILPILTFPANLSGMRFALRENGPEILK